MTVQNSEQSLEILIVDDHASFLKIISKFLRRKRPDWKVTALDDSLQALLLANALQPQVAILDLFMTVSGLQIARDLHLISPATKIILLSLYDDEPYRKMAFEAGVNEYICKSDCYSKLIPAVERLVSAINTKNQPEEVLDQR